MQTKLTLRLDDHLIARAKTWARANDTSLSEAVGQFFAQLPEADHPRDDAHLSPWVRSLIDAARAPRKSPPDETEDVLASLSPWARSLYGIARPLDGAVPSDAELLERYIDYLAEKYR